MPEPDALLAGQLAGDASGTALIAQGRSWTRGELGDYTSRLSSILSARLQPGDLLAIWLPNGPEILALYLACFQTGIVPMPLQPGLKWPELSKILMQARAAGLVTTTALAIAPHGELLKRVEWAWSVSEGPDPLQAIHHDAPAASFTRSPQPSNPNRLALVLHTSGSSGQPKAVALSHENLHHILCYRLTHCDLDPHSVSVVASCVAQTVGLYQCLALLAAGATTVLLESYEAEALAEAVNCYRPTHLIMVVSAWDSLLHHPQITAHSLANLRFAAAGADRLRPRIQERFRALAARPLRQSYGLTESSWALINEGDRMDKCLALGKPSPGVQIRLLGTDERQVPSGAVGQIQIKSPRTMLGYLHDEKATQSAIVDGWLQTGDLAHQDEDGYYWFAGRSNDLIVLASGDNVSPAEIEGVLCGHPAVAACMVVGRTTEAGSEVPWAYVVPAKETSLVTLRAFLREQLSDYKLPDGIELVSELPLGLSGKIQRIARN